MGIHLPQGHYQMTRVAIALGAGNPLMKSWLRRNCGKHGVSLRFSSIAVDLVKINHVIRISPRNWIYAPTIAESFDAYFGQVEPSTNEGMLVVDYRGPRLQTYRSSGLQFEINTFPEEDTAIEDYFHWYRPKEGDIVFDLGAYCGVSTYSFSKCVGQSGRVVAFEPDASSYALLLRNIDRHRLRNVVPLQLAVAATSGDAEFNQEGTLGSVLSRHSPRATTGITSTVATIDLAAACSRFGLPAYIKVDIEGSEVEVLETSRQFLASNSIQFALDTHHWVNGTRTTDQVERIFGECGYETTSSNASGFWTTWARPAAGP